MAYYANGTLIGGANTLPKMTMAEYLALPVSERPTYWECTDKDYDEISAEDVTYGSGTVKDALDEAQILDTYTLTSANNGSIKFFKKNGVVTAIISELKAATNGEVVTFGTLPSSYRPTEQINVNPRDMNEPNGSVFLVIKSTGEVTMENYGFSTAGATMNNAHGYLCTYLV
jgi:hypothetical protein